MIAHLAHPYIILRLAGKEAHGSQAVGAAFRPPNPTTFQTVEGFLDDEYVSLAVTKLGAGDDVYFLLGVGFKVSIADISAPDLHIVEFSDKRE